MRKTKPLLVNVNAFNLAHSGYSAELLLIKLTEQTFLRINVNVQINPIGQDTHNALVSTLQFHEERRRDVLIMIIVIRCIHDVLLAKARTSTRHVFYVLSCALCNVHVFKKTPA